MARRRGHKDLSSEDRELWRQVAKTVRRRPLGPLPNTNEQTGAEHEEKGEARPVSGKMPVLAPPSPQRSHQRSDEQLDGNLDRRLKRGRLEPERTLDLHGMSAARAEAALRLFVEQSRAEGVRLVLVITGKGRARSSDDGIMPVRKGILRDHLPVWVGAMGNSVVKTTVAHKRHGGAGAFYLYLRRRRADR